MQKSWRTRLFCTSYGKGGRYLLFSAPVRQCFVF
jgi:hypothetical protein